MTRFVLVTAVVVSLVLASGTEAGGPHGGGPGSGASHGFGRPGGHGFGRGGGYGWHHPRTRFFVGGSVFFDPFFYDPFFYPYYVPYPYPAYVYPPPPDYGWSAPAEPPSEDDDDRERAESRPSTPEDAARATYGLVQLRGIPDGASVDLDGRFWLTAEGLDQRWLAVPRGEHTVSVRVRDSDVVERRIDVKEGKNHVVRFGPFRHATG